MKLKEFIIGKAVTLCFIGIGALLSTAFLLASGVRPWFIFCSVLFLFLLILFWFLFSYRKEKGRLQRLQKILEELPEKYLLGELLPSPQNSIEKEYFEVMKTISRSAIAAAEQAIRDKEDYCTYVESWIHEIKTPLTACSLILANDRDTGKLKRELKRADNLTESILYYARAKTPEKDKIIREIQVASVMEEAVRDQMALLIAAGISIELSGDFTVYTDDKALGFILKQLLVNAANYCKGCRVLLQAENGKITVEDNGPGIWEHEIRRVTDKGFTGTNGRMAARSTGMGLYLVKELCGQLNIELKIESVRGEFTRFTLCFLTKL